MAGRRALAWAVHLYTASRAILCAPVFVPLATLTRPRRALRPLTLGLGVRWAVLTGRLAARLPDCPTGPALLSLYYPAYYYLLTGALRWRRRQLRTAV